ncbi:MAG: TlpA family protein disulfide reductase [Acidobacteria bacterium]|nr:TlpA family protein disulfide reductase [Acidobacteriota bacterium]
MRKVSLLATALALACPQALAQTPPPAAAAPAASVTVGVPKFMPEEISGLELKELGGRSFRLSDFRGRVYVLNLWATWCGPCRVEIPGFNKLHADYSARGVEFVGLTTEDPELDGDKVRGFAREMGMKYRLGWLDRETARVMASWGPPRTPPRPGISLPQTFVVGSDGQIVLHVRGYNARVPDMIRAGVEKALAFAQAAPAAPDRPQSGAPARP